MNTPSNQTDLDDTSSDVHDSIVACQLWHARWIRETDPAQREIYGQAHRAAVEQLFELLDPYLERIALGWLRSGMAQDISSLKYSLFVPIFQALPGLRIDPEKNARNLLLMIARHGIYDMYRQDMHGTSGRSKSSSTDGDTTHMWPRASSLDSYRQATDEVDQASIEAEDTWIAMIDNREYLDAITRFWEHALVPVDKEIIGLRLRDLTFKEIAGRLAPGWEESTVRQRYHRVIVRTRQHLQAIGLIHQI